MSGATILLRLLGVPWALVLCLVATVVTVPMVVIVWLVDLLGSLGLAAGRRSPTRPADTDRSRVSCITVSWDGKHFLEKLLPSLCDEIERWDGEAEIVVVDNGSVDGTSEWLAAEWPHVRVVRLPENRYFVRGAMAGVEAAQTDTLVVLNNDMIVQPGFLSALLEPLAYDNVFAVSSQIFMQNASARREESGLTSGGFHAGVLKLAHDIPSRDQENGDVVPTLWAGGGSSAYDRRAFLALGGFDTLYDPFYMEDAALSYGAWKRGMNVLFAPGSSVLHAHRGTSRKAFGDHYVDGMIRRNQHLFCWKHITSPVPYAGSVLSVALLCLARWKGPRGPLRGPWFEFRAFFAALRRWPQAVIERQGERRHAVRSDQEVFAVSRSIHLTRAAVGASRGTDAARLRVLMLTARVPQRGRDGAWALRNLVETLALRHQLTVVAFTEDPKEDADDVAALEELGVCIELVRRERHDAWGDLHRQTPERIARDYAHPRLRRALADVLATVDFDVVQVDYAEMAHVAAPLVRDLPTVHVCHESLAVAAARGGDSGQGLRRAAAWEARTLSNFDHVVCLSDLDAEALTGLGITGPKSTIPTAIDPSGWARDVAPEPDTVIFVGSFRHGPNLDAVRWLVDEVFVALRRIHPGARLRVVGANPPADLVERGAEGVVFDGFVEDLATAVAEAAVMVVPVRQGGGIRSKVLEAWAARRPVVGTRVAFEAIRGSHGNEWLEADDAEGLAEHLASVLRDQDLAQRMATAGRARVEASHSVVAQGDAYEGVYRSVMAGARR